MCAGKNKAERVRNLIENAVLFLFGGVSYGLMELIWRGWTHWTMVIAGGCVFLLMQQINRRLLPHIHYIAACVVSGLAVTAVELVFGLAVNVWLGWNVWDYSHLPLNLFGQVSLPFTAIWTLLSVVALTLERQVRFRMFGDIR